MLFSPGSRCYSSPQRVMTIEEGSGESYRSITIPGPFVSDRPYFPMKIQAGMRSPEFPYPNATLIQPERATLYGSTSPPYISGEHYATISAPYYHQDSYQGNFGYFFSPFHRLTDFLYPLPEFLEIDIPSLLFQYSIEGDIFHSGTSPWHIGKLLFRRFDGNSYIENDIPGSTGLLGGPAGIYQNSTNSNLGYFTRYRPIYNITQRRALSKNWEVNQYTHLSFSPCWLYYDIFPSGGGDVFDGILSSPTWHVQLPFYDDNAQNSIYLLLFLDSPSGGTFTLTFNGESTDPIPFVSDISAQVALVQTALLSLDGISTSDIEVRIASVISIEIEFGGQYQYTSVSLILTDNLIGGTATLGLDQSPAQPSLLNVTTYLPRGWYKYIDGASEEIDKWYPGKPTEQNDPDVAIAVDERFTGIRNEQDLHHLGTLSLRKETEFIPSIITDIDLDMVLSLSATPNDFDLTRGISVSPVTL